MKKIVKLGTLLMSIIMIFSISANIRAYAEDVKPSLTISTENIHKEQVAGVKYKLSPILGYEKYCEIDTGEVIKEWTTTDKADVLNLAVGEYELVVTDTPKNYFSPEDNIYFSIDADGVIKTFGVNWYGDKYDEVAVDGNTLSNVLHYRDGFVIKNETGKTVCFFVAQKFSKNVLSSDDSTANVAVYNADGTVKQEKKDITTEEIKRVNLYEVTLDDGEYIELYDRHVEGVYIFAEKTEGVTNTFSSDVEDSIKVFDKDTNIANKDMSRHIPTVESKVNDWQAVVVNPVMNDTTGEEFDFGGGDYMWGRSSIPHTIILSGEKVLDADNNDQKGPETDENDGNTSDGKTYIEDPEAEAQDTTSSDDITEETDIEESAVPKNATVTADSTKDTNAITTSKDNEKNLMVATNNSSKSVVSETNVPQTGDTFNAVFWFALLTVSAFGYITIRLKTKKN